MTISRQSVAPTGPRPMSRLACPHSAWFSGRNITLPIDLQNDVGLRQQFPECPSEYVEWLRQTLYLGHDLARSELKVAAARQKKNFHERCREASFIPGEWVWKIDSVAKVGKLHNKNLGPYLVIAKTGPVNYQIQGTPEGRLSTLHVDKLYKYTPTEGEELLSWLPVAKKSKEIASQSTVKTQVDSACQTEVQCLPTEVKGPPAPDVSPISPGQRRNPSPPPKVDGKPNAVPAPTAVTAPRRSQRQAPAPSRYRGVRDGGLADNRIAVCLAETILRLNPPGTLGLGPEKPQKKNNKRSSVPIRKGVDTLQKKRRN